MKKIKLFNGKKSIIIINLLLILALMTGSVYAWFAVNVENKVDVYEIEVEADNALELSFTGTDGWGTSLNLNDLEDEEGNSVLKNMKFVEVTGNGTEFQIPVLEQWGTHATVNTDVDWTTTPSANSQYLKFSVYMRSEEPLNVFLSSDSAASPVAETISGTDCDNPTDYGNKDFSKDCVVGALRVFFNDNENNRNIWITNPQLHLSNPIKTTVYEMDFDSTAGKHTAGDGKTEGAAYEWNDSYVHYYYNSSKDLSSITSESTDITLRTSLPETVSENPYESGGILIASLTGEKDEKGYYTDSAEFTIWLEGCDTEARRALVGGKFKLSLVFDSLAPMSTTTE